MKDKNKNWKPVAKDYNSPFIRNYFWAGFGFDQAKLFDIPQALIGIASRDGDITYFYVDQTWTDVHNVLKERVLSDLDYLENIIKKTNDKGEEMNDWSEKNILKRDLENLSSNELFLLLKTGFSLEQTVYAYGVLLPYLDFQGFSFVEGNLKKILSEKVDERDYQKYFQAFTSPTYNSFSQDQEEDLLRLIVEFYYNKEWVSDVLTKNFLGLQSTQPSFCELLEKHTEKYAWVYYVYAGSAYKQEDFLKFIKDELNNNVDPNNKLSQIKIRKDLVKNIKDEFFNLYKLTDFENKILYLSGLFVWAKPRRKDYQSKTYFHLEKLQREIGKRLHLSLDQVRSAPIEMLEQGLGGIDIDLNIINSIKKLHVCVPREDGEVDILYGKEAEDFFDKYLIEDLFEIGNISKFKGDVACPGKVSGSVKIVNTIIDLPKMKQGDVLVSVATSPAIVAAMKKAVAIVTDEGGLTCHAAIVSRELNIPCVIGAKIATKVLKDGDMVEVDANSGFVKKI